MYLSRVEEAMYRGDYGGVVETAIKVIVKVGEALGAERLVEVSHVHVSGVSYWNIGDPGLEYIESLSSSGAWFRVYTSVNPVCIDLGGDNGLFGREYASGQKRIMEALERLGVDPVYTCIPYSFREPARHQHLAWGESNAVAVANSVYGARTNREGGPLTIAAAITGRTYYAGLHLMENRVVSTIVSISKDIVYNDLYASLIGLYIGEYVDGIPLIREGYRWSFYMVKEMLASSAASGSHSLVVLDGVTPRDTYLVGDRVDRVSIDKRSLDKFYEEVSSEPGVEGYTLAYIGCPHLDRRDLEYLVERVRRYKGLKRDVLFLVTIPYRYHGLVDGLVKTLESRGIHVAYGVCPIVSVLSRKPDKVLTNSGKALFYLKRLHGFNVALGSIDDIVREVMVE